MGGSDRPRRQHVARRHFDIEGHAGGEPVPGSPGGSELEQPSSPDSSQRGPAAAAQQSPGSGGSGRRARGTGPAAPQQPRAVSSDGQGRTRGAPAAGGEPAGDGGGSAERSSGDEPAAKGKAASDKAERPPRKLRSSVKQSVNQALVPPSQLSPELADMRAELLRLLPRAHSINSVMQRLVYAMVQTECLRAFAAGLPPQPVTQGLVMKAVQAVGSGGKFRPNDPSHPFAASHTLLRDAGLYDAPAPGARQHPSLPHCHEGTLPRPPYTRIREPLNECARQIPVQFSRMTSETFVPRVAGALTVLWRTQPLLHRLMHKGRRGRQLQKKTLLNTCLRLAEAVRTYDPRQGRDRAATDAVFAACFDSFPNRLRAELSRATPEVQDCIERGKEVFNLVLGMMIDDASLAPPAGSEPPDLSAWTVRELKEALRERGLLVSGAKPVLVKRLEDHMRQHETGALVDPAAAAHVAAAAGAAGRPPGLRNHGSTCHVASALQALRLARGLVAVLLNHELVDVDAAVAREQEQANADPQAQARARVEGEAQAHLTRALQVVLGAMETSGLPYVDPAPLLECLYLQTDAHGAPIYIDIGRHEDAAETLQRLLQAAAACLPAALGLSHVEIVERTLVRNQGGDWMHARALDDDLIHHAQSYALLDVEVLGYDTVVDSLAARAAGLEAEFVNDHGVQVEALRQERIVNAPNMLFLHLRRHVLGEDGHRRKVTNRIAFPLALDIGPYMLHEPEEGVVYDLVALSAHRGTVDLGHHVTAAQDPHAGGWNVMDDGAALPCDPDGLEQFLEQFFGQGEHGPLPPERQFTANVLVYRRRNAAPPGAVAMPPDLAAVVAESVQAAAQVVEQQSLESPALPATWKKLGSHPHKYMPIMIRLCQITEGTEYSFNVFPQSGTLSDLLVSVTGFDALLRPVGTKSRPHANKLELIQGIMNPPKRGRYDQHNLLMLNPVTVGQVYDLKKDVDPEIVTSIWQARKRPRGGRTESDPPCGWGRAPHMNLAAVGVDPNRKGGLGVGVREYVPDPWGGDNLVERHSFQLPRHMLNDMAGTPRRVEQHNELMERHWDVRLTESRKPSTKVASVEGMMRWWRYLAANWLPVYDFYLRKSVLRERFHGYQKRQSMLAQAANTVRTRGEYWPYMTKQEKAALPPLSHYDRATLIGLGDATFDPNQPSLPPGPTFSTLRAIQSSALNVLWVKESYTSKHCCACEEPTVLGEVEVQGPGGRTERPWRLRRCPRCGTFFHRDVPAGQALAELAECAFHGDDRPLRYNWQLLQEWQQQQQQQPGADAAPPAGQHL